MVFGIFCIFLCTYRDIRIPLYTFPQLFFVFLNVDLNNWPSAAQNFAEVVLQKQNVPAPELAARIEGPELAVPQPFYFFDLNLRNWPQDPQTIIGPQDQ